MSYQLQLDSFAGPLDLLLHLIEKNEMDIYDIKIAEITQQYLDYLGEMQTLDLEIASEFIVMASRLLYIKARMLLPTPPPEYFNDEYEEEIDPQEQLIRDLLEYKRIKSAAGMLAEFREQQSLSYTRPNEEGLYTALFGEKNPLEGKTLTDLTQALAQILRTVEQKELVMAIKKEGVSIGAMMDDLFTRLKNNGGRITFNACFATDCSRYQVIVRFLALLELMRRAVVRTYQAENFSEIYILAADLDKYQSKAEIV